MSATTVASSATRPVRLPLRLQGALVGWAPLVVGVIVTLPLLLLLVNSFNVAAPGREATYGITNWTQAFSDPTTLRALWNSIALGAVRTLISLPIAIGVAWLVARGAMPGRPAIGLLCGLGIFLPLLPLTFGWILLLDPQCGVINTP